MTGGIVGRCSRVSWGSVGSQATPLIRVMVVMVTLRGRSIPVTGVGCWRRGVTVPWGGGGSRSGRGSGGGGRRGRSRGLTSALEAIGQLLQFGQRLVRLPGPAATVTTSRVTTTAAVLTVKVLTTVSRVVTGGRCCRAPFALLRSGGGSG